MDTLRVADMSIAAYVVLKGGELKSVEWFIDNGNYRGTFVLEGNPDWVQEFYSSDFEKHRNIIRKLKREIKDTDPRQGRTHNE